MPAILLPGEVRVKLAWCRKLLMLRRLEIGSPEVEEVVTFEARSPILASHSIDRRETRRRLVWRQPARRQQRGTS